jgi:hypothetical protein
VSTSFPGQNAGAHLRGRLPGQTNLHARILVGPRVMAPQLALAGRIKKLEEGGRGDS